MTHYLKAKPYFCPVFFCARYMHTVCVITSRMYSGSQQQNYYFDDLSCLKGLLYSNLQNVAFDFELAVALPIIIVVPAMEIICTLHATQLHKLLL